MNLKYFSIILIFQILIINMTMSQSITFTSKFFYEDNPYISEPQQSFSGNDAIYGIAEFRDAIMNMPITDNPSPRVMIGYFLTINGEAVTSTEKGTFAENVPGAMYSMEYGDTYGNDPFPFCLIPSDDDRYKGHINKQGPYKAFMEALATHGQGTHSITFELKFMDQGNVSEAIASGTFTIGITGAIKANLASKFPAAKTVDQSLTNSMIAALKDNGWTYKVKKINITDADWKIHRNGFGNIFKRTIDTYVGFEMPDGKCKVFNISFKQDYDGSYGKTQTNATGQSYEVNCNEIK